MAEAYSFREVVAEIAVTSDQYDLPMPMWIREMVPGANYVTLTFADDAAARMWIERFRRDAKIDRHRAEAPVQVWGWHGWTVDVLVMPTAIPTPTPKMAQPVPTS